MGYIKGVQSYKSDIRDSNNSPQNDNDAFNFTIVEDDQFGLDVDDFGFSTVMDQIPKGSNRKPIYILDNKEFGFGDQGLNIKIDRSKVYELNANILECLDRGEWPDSTNIYCYWCRHQSSRH